MFGWGECEGADGGRAESKTTKLGVLVEMLNSVGWEGELNHAQKHSFGSPGKITSHQLHGKFGTLHTPHDATVVSGKRTGESNGRRLPTDLTLELRIRDGNVWPGTRWPRGCCPAMDSQPATAETAAAKVLMPSLQADRNNR